jgi:uncharacterized protein with GYD domain
MTIIRRGSRQFERGWCSRFNPAIGHVAHDEERTAAMPTYIVLGQFTDQGIRNVKDTTKRAEALKDLGKKAGATIKEVYWTIGQYDVVTVVDAPDDATLTSLMLKVGALGNVRTQSLRAFTAEEMGRIIGKLA